MCQARLRRKRIKTTFERGLAWEYGPMSDSGSPDKDVTEPCVPFPGPRFPHLDNEGSGCSGHRGPAHTSKAGTGCQLAASTASKPGSHESFFFFQPRLISWQIIRTRGGTKLPVMILTANSSWNPFFPLFSAGLVQARYHPPWDTSAAS